MARQKRENLHKVRDFVYATRQDAAEVTNILLAEFPNLRILPINTNGSSSTGKRCANATRASAFGEPTTAPSWTTPPVSLCHTCRRSRTPSIPHSSHGWNRMAGRPYGSQCLIIFAAVNTGWSTNQAPKSTSSGPTSAVQHGLKQINDPIAPRHSREQIFLPDGRMLGAYDREDPEAKAFIFRAFRVMAKFFSTRLIPCNRDTLQPYWSEADRIWGTWVRPPMRPPGGKQRRHNYLGDYYKPEGYKFRAGTKLWAGTPPDPDAWKALLPGGPEWEKRAGRVEKWLYRKERKT